MTIAEKKQEILQLIEQLHKGPSRAPSPGGGLEPPAKLLDKRIARRREELSSLRDQRQRTALHLLEERLLAVCDTLDRRISRIEQVLENQQARGAAPQPSGGALGTEIASDLSDMQPDTGMFSALPQAVHAAAPPPRTVEAEHTLSGKIEEGVLTDILQFISTNDKTGVFVTVSASGKTQVYFREGQIYHCAAGDITGENALFVAMSVEQGRFYFDETQDIPDEKTIDGNTQFLILEALRQIDESRGGE